jgi:aminoglycoside/choline kinase family phosphotransferase
MAPEPIVHGMILAAGFGTRLAPVTDHVPKPLLPVGGATLLDHAVAAFDRGGIDRIAVNTHHLGALVEDHLQQRPDSSRFSVFPEVDILGTGGALHGAREFLATADHFLVFNGDVLCDVDLSTLVEAHLQHRGLATLLLIDRPEINTVYVGADNSVVHIEGASPAGPDQLPGDGRALTYSGIGVFSRSLLDDIGPGFSSLITPLVRSLAADPGSVKGVFLEGVFWDDLGTLPRFLRVCQQVNESPAGFSWLQQSVGAAEGPLKLELITGHGSDRLFWRMITRGWSAVAMQCPDQDGQADEFRRHRSIGDFLHQCDLGSAEILAADEQEKTMLMEDLGQASLFFLARNPGTPAQLLAARYRQVVDHLLRLQAFTDNARAECPLAVDRTLGFDDFLWETNYFRERFLIGHLGFTEENTRGLIPEFEALAHCVANQPLVLLHRDFQSQNIHFQNGKVRLVDFQGMRLGPVGYDIMSLVMDPYVNLPGPLQEELLDRFAEGCGFDAAEVRIMALAAGMQRLMQALGAYGYLGHVKGKTTFLEHIPRGWANLVRLFGQSHMSSGKKSPWMPDSMPRLRSLLK